jgi:glycine/serine hydroxymethyltransferase
MPGQRWYPGGEAIEVAAITRARSMFHFPAANLQAHSATQAKSPELKLEMAYGYWA